MASCMTNLYEFLIVVSPSVRVHLNNVDFAGHLCQTINNVVKQNQSASILSLLRKRGLPQLDQALEYFAYMLLTNLEILRRTQFSRHWMSGMGPKQWHDT